MSDELIGDEGKLMRQRKFYLYMSPFEGHNLAQSYGNFELPSNDVVAEELKDILKMWLTVQASSIGTVLSDSAWWMLRVLDEHNRMGAEDQAGLRRRDVQRFHRPSPAGELGAGLGQAPFSPNSSPMKIDGTPG